MAITIKSVPDSRQNLGRSLSMDIVTIAPGVSDYVTGGYVIGASGIPVSGFVHFYGITIIGVNATGLGYVPQIIAAQTATPIASVLTLKLAVLQGSGGTPAGTINMATVTNAGTTKPVYTNTITSVETLTQTTGNPTIAGITFTGAAGSASKLVEVASGANLTGVVWTATVWGY